MQKYLWVGVLGLTSSLAGGLDPAVGHGADRDGGGTEDRGCRLGDVDAGDLTEHVCNRWCAVC